MVNNLTVAWATPVNVYDLGARLEAYVEGKATISTFRSCIGNAHTDAPLTKLPPELVEIVADYVRRPILERRQKTWEASRCCCQRMCFPTDHLTDAQISNYKVDLFGEDCELFDDRILDFEDELRANGIGEAEHDLKIDDFLEKIDECLPYTKSTSPFQRCKHVRVVNLELGCALTSSNRSSNKTSISRSIFLLSTISRVMISTIQKETQKSMSWLI